MIPKTKRIFISFANEAKPLASKIVEALRKKGYEPWIYTDEMLAGQDWGKVLEIELDKSDRCIGLITKSVVEDTERKRVVWKELKAAIKRSAENGAYNTFLIPVLVNVSTIPAEIQKFHAIDYDRDGIEAILKAVRNKEEKATPEFPQTDSHKITEPQTPQVNQQERNKLVSKDRAFKIFLLLIFTTIFIILGFYFTINWNKSTQPPKARFQTQVIDKYTHLPVKDVTAYILNKNKNDTIAISDPSGSDGRVYFELDTSQRITISVNFRQQVYEDDRVLYELPSSLVLPQFALTPKIKPDTNKKQTTYPAAPKYYWIEGAELTIEQRQKIKQSCGYEYRQGEGIKFSYDYNHDNYAVIPSGFRFKGSEVKISGNGFGEVVGKALEPSPSIALSKEEWESRIKPQLEQHAAENQDQIFQLIKQWLCTS